MASSQGTDCVRNVRVVFHARSEPLLLARGGQLPLAEQTVPARPAAVSGSAENKPASVARTVPRRCTGSADGASQPQHKHFVDMGSGSFFFFFWVHPVK